MKAHQSTKPPKTPLVSVVIPTFNRASLLPRAIDSVMAQTVGDWEIVLVDDGSTDHTRSLATRYRRRLGTRLNYVRQRNQGSSAARNLGIDLSRGKFVAFLDSDDEFLENKLERQLELFKKCPSLGLVFSDFSFVDMDGVRHKSVFKEITPESRSQAEEVAPEFFRCASTFFDQLLQQYLIATIVGLVRRDVLSEEVRFPIGLSYAEEWLFYLKIAKRNRVGYVDEPLCLHHHVRFSLSRTDRHQNTLGTYALLKRMQKELEPLTTSQRAIIAQNLEQTARQLGFDGYHTYQYREAARRFVEAFKFRPSARSAWDAAHALFKAWLPNESRRSGMTDAQATDDPVR